MSRTWRRDDSGRKLHGDNRRNKRREKANSHYSESFEKKLSREDSKNYKTNWHYELDTDTD